MLIFNLEETFVDRTIIMTYLGIHLLQIEHFIHSNELLNRHLYTSNKSVKIILVKKLQ